MNIIQLPTDAVEVKDGHPVTSSLRIADIFGKQHKDVLKRIENLDCSEEFRQRNFAPTVYSRQNPSGGKAIDAPMYELTRDGFAYLCMGFTGARAAAFKEAYIERFNAMEAQPHRLPNFGLSVPPVLTLGEYIETRDHLNDLKAELDVLFAQFKEVDVRCKPAEIEAMNEQYIKIGPRIKRVRDLVGFTEAHNVPRPAVEEFIGINNGNMRKQAHAARHLVKKEAA